LYYVLEYGAHGLTCPSGKMRIAAKELDEWWCGG
jgi:hypothetical protein